MRQFFISCLLAVYLTLTGCFHIASNEQGNTVTQSMLKQLKPGMSTKQVTYILGHPILASPYAANELSYVYMYANKTENKKQHLTVFFKQGKYVTYRTNYEMTDTQIINDWQAKNKS